MDETSPDGSKEVFNLIVDTREPKAIKDLVDKNEYLKPKFKNLAAYGAGDYVIGTDYLVERKTWADLIRSIVDGSLWKQIMDMQELQELFARIILVEGSMYTRHSAMKRSGWSEDRLNGVLNSITLEWGIQLVFTSSKKTTIKYLEKLTRKSQGETKHGVYAIRAKGIKNKSTTFKQRFFLEGLPGIGPTKAIKLLEAGQRVAWILENFIMYPSDRYIYHHIDLNKLIGKATAEKIGELLQEDYKEEE